MPIKPDYRSYSDLAKSLEVLDSELRALGIAHCIRVHHCRNRLEELKQVMEGGPIRRPESEYFSDLYEAAELAELSGAHASFGVAAHSRLRRAVRGSTTSSRDSTPDGRNVSFELALALRALHRGARVDLPEDGDVSIRTDSYRFLAECKRPQSLSALKRNMEKAARQGSQRIETERDWHVVLIDASYALNSFFAIRRTNLSRDRLYIRAHRWLRAFTERDGLRVNGIAELSHIGILVRYSSFGIAAGEMFHCQAWAVYPNVRLGVEAETPLRALAELFDPNYGESSSFIAML